MFLSHTSDAFREAWRLGSTNQQPSKAKQQAKINIVQLIKEIMNGSFLALRQLTILLTGTVALHTSKVQALLDMAQRIYTCGSALPRQASSLDHLKNIAASSDINLRGLRTNDARIAKGKDILNSIIAGKVVPDHVTGPNVLQLNDASEMSATRDSLGDGGAFQRDINMLENIMTIMTQPNDDGNLGLNVLLSGDSNNRITADILRNISSSRDHMSVVSETGKLLNLLSESDNRDFLRAENIDYGNIHTPTQRPGADLQLSLHSDLNILSGMGHHDQKKPSNEQLFDFSDNELLPMSSAVTERRMTDQLADIGVDVLTLSEGGKHSTGVAKEIPRKSPPTGTQHMKHRLRPFLMDSVGSTSFTSVKYRDMLASTLSNQALVTDRFTSQTYSFAQREIFPSVYSLYSNGNSTGYFAAAFQSALAMDAPVAANETATSHSPRNISGSRTDSNRVSIHLDDFAPEDGNEAPLAAESLVLSDHRQPDPLATEGVRPSSPQSDITSVYRVKQMDTVAAIDAIEDNTLFDNLLTTLSDRTRIGAARLFLHLLALHSTASITLLETEATGLIIQKNHNHA